MAPKTAGTQAPASEVTTRRRRRGPVLVGALVVALLVAAGVWFFVLRPSSDAAAAEAKPEPEVGEVVALDPVSINLAEGSYLRLGIALQQSAEVSEKVDGSQALDLAIVTFSGRSTEELAKPQVREDLKAALLKQVEHAYPDEVVDLYITEFVTQ